MATPHDRQTRAAIAGYADALTYVQQAARFEVFTYHPMLLSVLHFTMMRSELERSPGRYRPGLVWGSGGSPRCTQAFVRAGCGAAPMPGTRG
ncbi:hypothetical protein [Frankia sp. Cr2]|uniref:hypothetical protein n=1 Tax=Frankia sp. Cr2 TaxID=3073932 RepID=UPI002AD30BDC|nr:hypothetical protein [Frankia sp. Cr2]